ncbi:MAG: pyridoxamine 5'-phosphate oxidase family protein [Crocosphaera sp.]
MSSKYHEGEIEIQEITGERNAAIQNAGVISDSIIPGAVPFVAQQSMVILSKREENAVWISMLTGTQGFCKVDAERKSVNISLPPYRKIEQNPVFSELETQDRIGGLFIELSTRRRLRVNGHIGEKTEAHFVLNVEEAYSNCPQYIQRRTVNDVQDTEREETAFTQDTGHTFEETITSVVENADTLFVGSASPDGKVDASHRGGNPGFIQIIDDQTLRIPDYKGNSMFNTFGNLYLNPVCGLLILDFENHLQYHLSGQAKLELNVPGTEDLTVGTNRWWDFHLEAWKTSPIPHQIDWQFVDYSPFNPSIVY